MVFGRISGDNKSACKCTVSQPVQAPSPGKSLAVMQTDLCEMSAPGTITRLLMARGQFLQAAKFLGKWFACLTVHLQIFVCLLGTITACQTSMHFFVHKDF